MFRRVVFALALVGALMFSAETSADDGLDILINSGDPGGIIFTGGAFTSDVFGWSGVVELVGILIGSEEENLVADNDVLINNATEISDLNFTG